MLNYAKFETRDLRRARDILTDRIAKSIASGGSSPTNIRRREAIDEVLNLREKKAMALQEARNA